MTKQQLGDLILKEQNAMWRVSVSLLSDEQDRADAIQNAIIRAFDRIGTLRKDQFAKTWLIRILINECHNLQRQSMRYICIDETAQEVWDDPQEDPRISGREQYEELYEALKKLPKDLRILVTLYYVEEFSVKEIAQIEELPEGTVKSRLSRARSMLRQLIKEER